MKLEQMSKNEFDKYLEITIPEYAEDKVKAGTWKEIEALELAKKSFSKLLPEGLNTKNNYLFSVFTPETDDSIGMIWVNVTDKKVFIYDFMIDSNLRGKGYGKKTLTLIENWAIEKEFEEIGLHVFAHNKAAYGLYKKMGYIETDITMVRKIR